MSTSRKKIAFIGECMIEMAPQGNDTFRQGFAGDTLNTAVYASRYCAPDWDVYYVTALGEDHFSTEMMHRWEAEGIQLSLVRRLPGRLPGLYLIKNDARGERSFYYYRSQAAARDMFEGAEGDHLCQQLLDFDFLYLSSITLAILHESSQHKLLACLKEAQKKSITLCFDSNFRPKLWPDLSIARQQIQSLYEQVQIALPSFDDEKLLFQDASPKETAVRLRRAGATEVVVKQGEVGYFLSYASESKQVDIQPQANVVDTTGAGDSFNGVYLACRLNNHTPDQAAKKAAEVAAEVTTHRGVIMPRKLA